MWHSIPSRLFLFLLVLSCSTPETNTFADELATRIQPLIDDFAGEAAVMVKNLKTGETFAYQANVPFPTASMIKFPIMIAAYDAAEKNGLSLDETVTLREEDKVPGSGILTSHFSAGSDSIDDRVLRQYGHQSRD